MLRLFVLIHEQTKLYYVKCRNTLCALRRDKYALAKPLHNRKVAIQRIVQANILGNKSSAQSMSAKMLKKAVCKITATKLLDKVCQKCRKQAGMLLVTCRSMKRMMITSQSDFGEADGLHYEEPLYYDAVYCLWRNVQALPIKDGGECVVDTTEGVVMADVDMVAVDVVSVDRVIIMKQDKEANDIPLTHYKCSPRCKQLTEDEVMYILSFRQELDKPIEDIVLALHNCDTCPHMHHCHTYKFDQDGSVQLVEKMGHPLVCYNEGTACTSKLRILRCASFHYPVLLRFLKSVYKALSVFGKAN